MSISGKVATFTFSDNVGISGYGVNQSNKEEPTYVETNNTSVTWTASNAGTYYVWVKDTVGNESNETFTIASTAFCAYNAGQTWNYGYTGGMQSFTTPCSGTYKLEVWGAQGGQGQAYNGRVATGGYGGYSAGNVSLIAENVIYIGVGGMGAYSGNNWNRVSGGYNGGAESEIKDTNKGTGGGGGGATHIGTRNGTLAQYGNTSGLFIVAGGGGGGGGSSDSDDPTPYGGTGGGTNGGSGTKSVYTPGSGGTQTGPGMANQYGWHSGSFGQGGTTTSSNAAGAGGGGLYGGGGSDHYSGGGGGSGYIGGVSGGSMQNGVRSGNGYARITLVSLSN